MRGRINVELTSGGGEKNRPPVYEIQTKRKNVGKKTTENLKCMMQFSIAKLYSKHLQNENRIMKNSQG